MTRLAVLKRLIDRVFAFEVIDGGRCPYLHRWRLASFGRKRFLYLHHFVGSDWSRDPHDHPKRFISIGLWGGYVEESHNWTHRMALLRFRELRAGRPFTERFAWPNRTVYRAPWIRSFPAAHIHRLILPPGGTCWTLVFTGRETKPWGFFYQDGTWVEFQRYMRSERPDVAKDC